MSYQETARFIKLPIDGYMDLLGITPNSSQNAIINAINNPKYRFVCAAVSRRQGKTYIANIIGQLVTLVPNCNVLLMSPNYSLSQISFDLQRQLIKHFELEVIRDNAKDKVIELSNHSTIRMGSINQVDSVVGRSYDLIIFDEAALVDGRDAFNVALRPTLDKKIQRHYLFPLLVAETTGLQSFGIEVSRENIQSGVLLEQLIMKILVYQK